MGGQGTSAKLLRSTEELGQGADARGGVGLETEPLTG